MNFKLMVKELEKDKKKHDNALKNFPKNQNTDEKGYTWEQWFNSNEEIKAELKGIKRARLLVKRTLDRVSTYRSEINNFINIGRQNSINDIENELGLI